MNYWPVYIYFSSTNRAMRYDTPAMTDRTDAVTIKFRLSSSDVSSALARHTLRKMWFFLLLPIVGVVSIAWALLDPSEPAVNLPTGCGLLAGGLLLFVISPVAQGRALMKTPSFSGLITVAVSEQGLEVTTAHSNATLGWTLVKGVAEMGNAILIYIKPTGFQIIPKREIPEGDLLALKDLLRIHTRRP